MVEQPERQDPPPEPMLAGTPPEGAAAEPATPATSEPAPVARAEEAEPPAPIGDDDPTPIGVDLTGTLAVLTEAIRRHPDAPSNYVVRGEFYLGRGEILAAAADFRRALQLAESGAARAAWGYVYTALADRAREGLRRCRG